MSDEAAPNADDVALAPADTLHGQLQRGRGQGFLRALQENPATVHALLYDCLIHDPRRDHQIEERADYYAHLVTATQMDLAPIEQHLRTLQEEREDWQALMAIETLGSLAYLGNAEAVAILRHYVAHGVKWDVALRQLTELADPAATADLADSLSARFATGKEMDQSAYFGIVNSDLYPLMQSWSLTHPEMARLLEEAEVIWATYWQPSPPEPPYEVRSTGELLAAIDGRTHREIEKILLARCNRADIDQYVATFAGENYMAWWPAFQCLVALEAAEPFYDMILHKLLAFFATANERALRGRKRVVASRILEQLPPDMTLPLARRWFDAPEWHLRKTGEDILEAQATLEDIPQVREALAATLAAATPYDSDDYRISGALDILARFPDIGLLPEVEAAFVQAGYSFARMRAARTMRVNAPAAFAATYAYECLWDCAEETRHIGCESVPLTAPGALERLHAMVANPIEDELVKEAIAKRITI